ncbi:unnamed protein product [Durusdinium trenchii]|uniref:Uncharacterized protein n=1 Tax=Durusdinium trenchii TaxID=1381693 RepID=A0ABP0PGA5_9DINO
MLRSSTSTADYEHAQSNCHEELTPLARHDRVTHDRPDVSSVRYFVRTAQQSIVGGSGASCHLCRHHRLDPIRVAQSHLVWQGVAGSHLVWHLVLGTKKARGENPRPVSRPVVLFWWPSQRVGDEINQSAMCNMTVALACLDSTFKLFHAISQCQ